MPDPVANELSGAATPNATSGDASPAPPSPWTPSPAAPEPGAPQTDPRPGGLLRRLVNPIVGRILLVGVIVVGGVLVRDFVSGNADDLRTGDCIDAPAMGQEVEDVQHHPCDQSHTAEVFAAFEYAAASGAAYPTDTTMDNVVLSRCYSEFATYTGGSFESREDLDMAYMSPTVQGWGQGDRTMTCILLRVDGAAMTSSMRNTAR
jgi:hypothetical protein